MLSSRDEDLAALVRLLTYAKTEAERLDLDEAVELLLETIDGVAEAARAAPDLYVLE
ncbi:MAG: hypothetical protein U1E56_06965 [Bauldia sp.]